MAQVSGALAAAPPGPRLGWLTQASCYSDGNFEAMMNTVTVVFESSDKHQDWWQDDGKSGLRPNAKLLNQQAEKLARCKFIAAMPRWAPSPQIDTDANLLQQAEQVARTKFINMHFFKDKHQTSHENTSSHEIIGTSVLVGKHPSGAESQFTEHIIFKAKHQTSHEIIGTSGAADENFRFAEMQFKDEQIFKTKPQTSGEITGTSSLPDDSKLLNAAASNMPISAVGPTHARPPDLKAQDANAADEHPTVAGSQLTEHIISKAKYQTSHEIMGTPGRADETLSVVDIQFKDEHIFKDKSQTLKGITGTSGLSDDSKHLNTAATKPAKNKVNMPISAVGPTHARPPDPKVQDAKAADKHHSAAGSQLVGHIIFKAKHQTSHETNGTSGPAGETFHRCGQAVQGPAQLTYPVTKPDGTLPFWGE